MTTRPDIYTVEARRRFAESCQERNLEQSAKAYRDGLFDDEYSLAILAATLRELNWQPPVDPDEDGARLAMLETGGYASLPTVAAAKEYAAGWAIAITAYRAGKAAGGAA